LVILFVQVEGFDQYGMYRMDDMWLDENVFIKQLGDILEDKLLCKEEKKIMQQGKNLDIILGINDSLNTFFHTFTNGLKNIFGFVTQKALVSYVEKC